MRLEELRDHLPPESALKTLRHLARSDLPPPPSRSGLAREARLGREACARCLAHLGGRGDVSLDGGVPRITAQGRELLAQLTRVHEVLGRGPSGPPLHPYVVRRLMKGLSASPGGLPPYAAQRAMHLSGELHAVYVDGLASRGIIERMEDRGTVLIVLTVPHGEAFAIVLRKMWQALACAPAPASRES